MSAQPERAVDDEATAQGRVEAPKLPRILTAAVVVAIIAGSIWALSSPRLPFLEGAQPAPAPTKVAVIRANLPDEPERPTAARLGAYAPNFEWVEPGGATRKLSDLRGKVVVMNWWATWCGPCRAEMPALERVAQSEPEVAFLEVDLQEDEQQVVSFFERLDLRHLVPIIDPNGETAKRYALASLPMTYFLDREGIVRHIEIGGPMDDEAIRQGIAKARGR